MSDDIIDQVRAKIAAEGADWLRQLLGSFGTQEQGGQAASSASRRPAHRARPPSRLSPSPPRTTRRTSSSAASQPPTAAPARRRGEARTRAQARARDGTTATNVSRVQKPPASTNKARRAARRPIQSAPAPISPTNPLVMAPSMAPTSPASLFNATNPHSSTGPAETMGQYDPLAAEFEEGELPLEDTFSNLGSLSPDHFFSTQPPPSPPPLSPPGSASYEPPAHYIYEAPLAQAHSSSPRQLGGAPTAGTTQGTEAHRHHRSAGAISGVSAGIQPATTQFRSTVVRRAASTRSTSPGIHGHYGSPTLADEGYHLGRPRLRDTSGQSPRSHPVAVPATSIPANRDIPRQDRNPTVADLQRAGTSSGTGGNGMPSIPMAHGGGQLLSMVRSSVTPATWQAYGNAWGEWLPFTKGRNGEDNRQLRDSTIAYLLELRARGVSAVSAQRRLTGLAFFFKLIGWQDVTKHFIIRQALKGWKREGKKGDTRRPVDFQLLQRLLAPLQVICRSQYETALFQAAFSLAFFGALPISELVPPSAKKPGGLMQEDMIINQKFIRFRLSRSKTDIMGRGCWVTISAIRGQACPVNLINAYAALRRAGTNFLVHEDGAPLTRYQFSRLFNRCLEHLGLNKKEFGTHSFRIGAATEACLQGLSDSAVKTVGRWKSNCFAAYVRPNLIVN
ncbi:uncharacterized protein LOC100497302 [Xenopus tropicalis]|uniref:Uncharacterized protein LOC100497302 n=1 Tax=Xenopus tropicalis TaxID=8364 RepID=A0A8J1JJL9_XENTR|nr:uncharacterized protein LOC100497302 [Xenopus tropicalis]